MNNKYQAIIGLEVHVELKTNSKMFCSCSTDYFGKQPNTHTCPVCLGLPGALPIPNKKAIEWCIAIGLALNCEIADFSKFDRKNYFYPDLAKGYQISQYDLPFCTNGNVIQSEAKNLKQDSSPSARNDIKKKIRIRRVHMEEDTGKLIHEVVYGENSSLIDFNRSGVPLVEIVTEPDFNSGLEVKEYLQKIQQIVRYLGVSDADMEKGEMRLEPNISLRKCHDNQNLPNYKVEVKNINSFSFVEKAINYEIKRQAEILEKGEIPVQETRGWDEKKQITVSQRVKEEASDYRYFPEPDISPIRINQSQISNIKLQMTELPNQKLERFKKEYGLNDYDAEILTREKETAQYFEQAIRVSREISNIKGQLRSNRSQISNKTIANYIINKKIDINKILPAELLKIIISSSQAATITDDELEKIIKEVLDENPKAVEDYKKGKENVIMFLVGQVMRKARIKLDANLVKEKIKNSIK